MSKKILLILIVSILFVNCPVFADSNKVFELINNINSIDLNDINEKIQFSKSWFISNGLKYYTGNYKLKIDLRELLTTDSNILIAVNRQKATLTVYNIGEDSSAPIVSFACRPNSIKTPLGLFYSGDKYKWHKMFGHNNYCQYCIRIIDHFLLHSPIFSTKGDNFSLKAYSYNSLMEDAQSGGCIRLTTGDAYWLYNNMKEGTPIYIYDSEIEGPFGRPVLDLLPSDQNFDPTDPEIFDKIEKISYNNIDR